MRAAFALSDTTPTSTQPRATTPRVAYIALLITVICWGANTIFAKLAVGHVSPLLMVTLRWLGTVAVIMVIALPALRRDWPRLKTHWRLFSVMGALGYTGFNALFYAAAHHTTAINIGIVQGTMPAFVLLGAFLAYGERARALQWLGIATTMIGVVVLATRGDLRTISGVALNTGDLLIVGACVLYAGYTVGLRARPDVGALSLFAVLAFAAFIASLPLAVADVLAGTAQWPTTQGWFVIGLVVLLPSTTAQLLFMRGVAIIGPARAGVFINVVPVVAALLAVAILGEAFEGYHAVALGLVLGGVGLSEHGALR